MALGQLHCWNQNRTLRRHMQRGVLHKGSGVQCYKTHYMGQELSFKRDREKNHPARLSRRAAVCKVLQRLLLVQKVPPIP